MLRDGQNAVLLANAPKSTSNEDVNDGQCLPEVTQNGLVLNIFLIKHFAILIIVNLLLFDSSKSRFSDQTFAFKLKKITILTAKTPRMTHP